MAYSTVPPVAFLCVLGVYMTQGVAAMAGRSNAARQVKSELLNIVIIAAPDPAGYPMPVRSRRYHASPSSLFKSNHVHTAAAAIFNLGRAPFERMRDEQAAVGFLRGGGTIQEGGHPPCRLVKRFAVQPLRLWRAPGSGRQTALAIHPGFRYPCLRGGGSGKQRELRACQPHGWYCAFAVWIMCVVLHAAIPYMASADSRSPPIGARRDP